jgi:adiponectin receptor
VGSFYPCIYYGFFCEAHLQALYLSAITIVGFGWYPPVCCHLILPSIDARLQLLTFFPTGLTTSGAASIVLNPEYAKPSHRGARTAVFILLGLSAVVPVTHLAITHGLEEVLVDMGLSWLVLSGALYITGALL